MAISASQSFVPDIITTLATVDAQLLLSAHPALQPTFFFSIGLAWTFAVFARRLLTILLPAAVTRTAQFHVFAGVKDLPAISAGVSANPTHRSGRVGDSSVFAYAAFSASVLFVACDAIL